MVSCLTVEVIYTLGKNNSICHDRLSLTCILAFWFVSLDSGLADSLMLARLINHSEED